METRSATVVAVVLLIVGLLVGGGAGYLVGCCDDETVTRWKTDTVHHSTTVVREPQITNRNRTYPVREVTRWKTAPTTLPDTGGAHGS